MDIGTAKPDPATRERIAHHLIDIIDPDMGYSAASFRNDARRAIQEVHARGRVPLLVGGTMLYFKALREGLSELPDADEGVRAEIDACVAGVVQHPLQLTLRGEGVEVRVGVGYVDGAVRGDHRPTHDRVGIGSEAPQESIGGLIRMTGRRTACLGVDAGGQARSP